MCQLPEEEGSVQFLLFLHLDNFGRSEIPQWESPTKQTRAGTTESCHYSLLHQVVWRQLI